MRNDQKKQRIWEPFLIGVAAAIGLLAGYNIQLDNSVMPLIHVRSSSSDVIYQDGRIEEILRFIETNYVDSLDQNEIAVDAIRHILKQLDPHSDYITPEELSEHQERMDGSYRGIGIETIKMNDTFYITQVMENGPAKKSGLRVGDVILSVEGDTVSGTNTAFSEVRSKLKTREQDRLSLELKSVENPGTVVKQVSIAEIDVPSADISYKLDSQTVYIKLERFSGNTYEQFIESLDRHHRGYEKMNLVMDLRDNPGGYLPEAIKILSQLFPERDKLLTYTEGLNRKKAEYRSTGKTFYNIGKVVVLINENSASGSEILAGAIQDWDRGIIIGRESFGKGLVQEIFPLKNGGALRLTVAKYYTPTGRLIQKTYRSFNKDVIADSVNFQTRLLNREVESGLGIIPDVILDNPTEDICWSYRSYADFYIIRKMHELNSRTLERESLSIEEYNDFLKSDMNLELSEELIPCMGERTSDYIYNRYVRLVKGETEYYANANENDPLVREALKFIDDDRTTMASLLSKEE